MATKTNPKYEALLERLSVIDEPTLASLCDVSLNTVQQWRYRGQSPAFISAGNRILYKLADVEGWLAAKAQGDSATIFRSNDL